MCGLRKATEINSTKQRHMHKCAPEDMHIRKSTFYCQHCCYYWGRNE